MKIAITAESTIDLPKELLEKYEIKTIPFQVMLGETEYLPTKSFPFFIIMFNKKIY